MPSVLKRFLFWTLICSVSAAPSFVVAMSLFSGPDTIAAMIVGVFVFILGYTWVTGTETMRRVKRQPFVRRTLIVGYATRVGISIIFPVGVYVDLVCGLLSTSIVGLVLGSAESFAGILTTTLVQGVVLNVLLFVYMLPILGVMRLVCRKPPPEGVCRRCRYDLRASRDTCPECGEPVPDEAPGGHPCREAAQAA